MAALYASLTAISTSDYLTMYLCYAALLSIAIAAMFQIQTRPSKLPRGPAGCSRASYGRRLKDM